MAVEAHSDSLPADLPDWQQNLARTCNLVATTALLSISPIAFIWLPWIYAPSAAVAFTAGLVGAALLSVPSVSQRTQRWYFVTGPGIALGVFFVQSGWSPVNISAAFLVITIAGLLLGRTAVYFVGACVMIALFGGGVLIQAGLLHFDDSPLLPTQFGHWLRAGTLSLLTISVVAYLLRRTMRVIRDVHASTHLLLQRTAEDIFRSNALKAERIAKENDLRDAYRAQAISQLSNGLVHHFNNLLTVVRFAIDGLRAAPSSKVAHGLTKKIEETTMSGAAVLAKLTAFSRRDQAIRRRADVGAELLAFRDSLVNAVRDNVRLEVVTSSECYATLDPEGLRQIVLAAVLNAADAVSSGGLIDITVQPCEVFVPPPGALAAIRPGSYIAVSVADSGAGMPESTRVRAADPFFTTKNPETHTGLGLSTAFGLVEAAGGTLAIQSEPAGGTTLTAFFPASHDQQEPTRPASSTDWHPDENSPTAQAAEHERPARGSESPDAATSPPSREPTKSFEDLAAWEDRFVRRMLQIFTFMYCVALIPHPFIGFDRLTLIRSLGGPLVAVILAGIGGWVPRVGDSMRSALLFASMVVMAGPLVLIDSYLSAAPMALLVIMISMSAVLSSLRMTATLVAATAGVFVLGGLLHSQGIVSAHMQSLSPAYAGNWYRVAIMLGIALTIGGVMVLSVVSNARDSVERMHMAVADREGARLRREQEGERVLQMDKMTRRSSRLEAAGHLAGSVAHELNNALQALTAGTWPLSMLETMTEEQLDASIDKLELATDYAATLVGQFDLDLDANPHAERIVDLSKAIRRAARLVRTRSPRRIGFELQLQSGTYIRAADRDIYRVLFNITQNSIQAMPEGGNVLIQILKANDDVVLAVQDDGEGMDGPTRERAFEPFFVTEPRQTGTGSGLMTVKQLIDRSHGTLTVRSEPNVGTRIEIRWPLQPRPEFPIPMMTRTRDGGRGVVLVADDHDLVREAFCTALQGAGFDVLVAADGDEARDLLRTTENIDALCVDGVMPGYPTHELLQDSLAQDPDRPLIVCSGYLPKDLNLSLTREEFTLLPKPVGSGELIRVVTEALAKS